jgi:pimeloyl-ACP methyl ester carboxylesterase
MKRLQEDTDPKIEQLDPDKYAKYYKSYYLDYRDVHDGITDRVFGNSNIKKNVLDRIPDETTLVYIIGHSFGAWNGAHLAEKLPGFNRNAEMLITLDPVGEGAPAKVFPIYAWVPHPPAPKSKDWINVRANRGELKEDIDIAKFETSDNIAQLGHRWTILQKTNGGLDVNYTARLHHFDVFGMFYYSADGGSSPFEFMRDSIAEYFKGCK